MTESDTNDSGMPVHVAIIMDGNGRWASRRNLPRTMGHKEGLSAAKRVVAAAAKLGIQYITLYTFSTENWKRTVDEVGYLMALIKSHLRQEFAFYKENHIRIRHIGNKSGLPPDIQNEINAAENETAQFDKLVVSLAINYGGRDEILRAIHKLPQRSDSNVVTEEEFAKVLDTDGIPDPDLVIRTGGEMRISNFLTWQTVYSELYFSDLLWPDCGEQLLVDAIAEFKKRNRRFGGV